jgi:hypothetical protein
MTKLLYDSTVAIIDIEEIYYKSRNTLYFFKLLDRHLKCRHEPTGGEPLRPEKMMVPRKWSRLIAER